KTPHFLGSMVTSGVTTAPREVIDGQQRLTTAIISLCAIRDLYSEYNQQLKVTGITEYLEYRDRNGEQNYRLKNKDRASASRLNDNILLPPGRRKQAPEFDSESLEMAAYKEFDSLTRKALEGVDDVVQRLDEIRDSLLAAEVVYINVEDRQNAFTIFETLNDRGKSLTVMDLVKNMLFAEIPSGDEDSSERAWSQILQVIDDSRFQGINPDSFLYYAWNSRSNPNVSEPEIIEQARLRRSISQRVDCSEDRAAASEQIVEDLRTDARIIECLNNTLINDGSAQVWKEISSSWRRDKFDDICEHLYGILVSGSMQPITLLISLMRAYTCEEQKLSRSQLLRFLRIIERFQFRWSIAQKSSTASIRGLYRQAASTVSARQSSSDVERAIADFVIASRKLDATDVQFKEGINRLTYSKTKKKNLFKIRHILTRIEKSYNTTKLNLAKGSSIEHLHGLEGRSEATPRNSWIFKLGNLAIIPPGINSQLPAPFPEKSTELKKFINSEDIELSAAIEFKDWGPDKANLRLKAISERSLKIWPKVDAN
ncbi:DUF262 domain-containing protein, partial [Corynebacterium casei]